MIEALVYPLKTFPDSHAGYSWIVDSSNPPSRMRFDNATCEEIFAKLKSHDKLVKALEEARAELNATRMNIQAELTMHNIQRWEGVPEVLQKTVDMVDEALAAAKGE